MSRLYLCLAAKPTALWGQIKLKVEIDQCLLKPHFFLMIIPEIMFDNILKPRDISLLPLSVHSEHHENISQTGKYTR